MSGGSPMAGGGGGLMRQRHSHGYSSGGEDLEDDACSRLRPQPPLIELRRSWSEIVENIVWIVSAIFILYYGDGNCNFLFLIWHDHRVKRVEFYIGMVGIMLNAIFVLVAWNYRRKSGGEEKWDISNSSALPFVALIGVISFSLLSFALWPIWSFLTLPLLFTLLITGVVTVPYIGVLTWKRSHSDVLRID